MRKAIKPNKDKVQRPGPSKPMVLDRQDIKGIPEENKTISPTDFLPGYEALKKETDEITESKAWTAVNYGDAEKIRMLRAIEMMATNKMHVKPEEIVKEKRIDTGETNYLAMQQHIQAVQKNSAMQEHKSQNKLTLEHYKTLKKLERFYIALEKDNVLYGMNMHEQQQLMNVMQEAFRPGYTADLWCGYCIMEFIKEVYNEFNKWQANEKEQLSSYENLLVKDNF